ncbi:hypothetical protein ACWGJP_13865 [Microbacterium sp. NPDC055903]
MHWDRMFEDLEGQLASEWEAERAALDAESERLRISKVELRARMRSLCGRGAVVRVDLRCAGGLVVTPTELGADWVAASVDGEHGISIIPLGAIAGIRMDHGLLLSTLEPLVAEASLRERMTFGFVLRDLARRRIPVWIDVVTGHADHGTIDRAGADHLDLAEHDAGAPRRARDVRGMRVVPFSAIDRVRIDTAHP